MSASRHSAGARARANIALAKYWGKSDVALNLPAVPSISMTLDPLITETRVSFEEGLAQDVFLLDGSEASEKETGRVSAMLNTVRAQAGLSLQARVQSSNQFPTAAGLASSASGFAALATAARAAAGLEQDLSLESAMARQASASAARSIYGGYVELPAGTPGDGALCARPLADANHWDLRIVVAVTAAGRKKVGSTDGMGHTRDTSPYYETWVREAPARADQVRAGILARDLPRVGRAMEQSTWMMHASAMAADPALVYFRPATLGVLQKVRELREEGLGVWATADAGPHVKALCHVDQAADVRKRLEGLGGVIDTLLATPGPGVELL